MIDHSLDSVIDVETKKDTKMTNKYNDVMNDYVKVMEKIDSKYDELNKMYEEMYDDEFKLELEYKILKMVLKEEMFEILDKYKDEKMYICWEGDSIDSLFMEEEKNLEYYYLNDVEYFKDYGKGVMFKKNVIWNLEFYGSGFSVRFGYDDDKVFYSDYMNSNEEGLGIIMDRMNDIIE